MSVITTATETDLIARARTVASVADKHADEGDRKGDLSQPVVEALLRERILGMWTPKALGGSELDVVSSLRVLEHLTYGDPSTGWVAMAASLAIGTGAAYLKDAAVDELFGGGRFPVIAGQGTKPGTAVPDGDGFRLSAIGRSLPHAAVGAQWALAVGCPEAVARAVYVHTPSVAAVPESIEAVILFAVDQVDADASRLSVGEKPSAKRAFLGGASTR